MFRRVLSFIGVASTCSLFVFVAPVPASAHETVNHRSSQHQPTAIRHVALPTHDDARAETTATTATCAPVVVQVGDTLGQIATTHAVTWPYLAALNHIPDPNLIFPAQVFQVCGTATTPVSPTSAPATASAPAPVQAPATHKAAVPAPPAANHAAAPVVGGGSVQSMIRAIFGAYADQALAIAACESGYNPGATNRSSGAAGVFQFLRSTWAHTPYAGSSPYNASANIEAAHWVFVNDGYSWREWSCRA